MTAKEAIEAKIRGLETIPQTWVDSITGFQPRMAARFTRILSGLTTTSSGAIEMTAANLAAIDGLLLEMQTWMTQSEYIDIVSTLSNEFAGQQATTMAYFQTVFDSPAPVTTFAAELYQVGRLQLINDLIPENLTTWLWQPLRETLTNAIATGAGYTELLDSVQLIAQGGEGVDGYLMRYSRVVVSDTLATTDRAFTNIVANDLGLEWYRYLGGRINTTRCFCNKRNGGYFHKNEIKGWGSGIGVGECGYPWAGMNKGTNSETIFAYVGGYNCQHSLLPVSEFDVPREAAIKAIEAGWYKPGKTAKAHFKV